LAFNLILFYVFAAIAVVTTMLVVVQSNPVYSVLLLIGSFVGLAGLYVLLDAPFVAVIQIIVYAGAIMVLFLFVVMLLNAPREELVPLSLLESGTARGIGAVLAIAFAGELAWALSRSRAVTSTTADSIRRSFSVPEIGQRLFQEYAFAFEATSILILVAMVGAITLAGRHLSKNPRVKPNSAQIERPPLVADSRVPDRVEHG
jgi:NADH-quinone oxidoreductase subunit J